MAARLFNAWKTHAGKGFLYLENDKGSLYLECTKETDITSILADAGLTGSVQEGEKNWNVVVTDTLSMPEFMREFERLMNEHKISTEYTPTMIHFV